MPRKDPSTMTSEELAREADRLYLDAALMLTNLSKPMRRAARLVLLSGIAPAAAARQVRKKRQNVNRALRTVESKLIEVKAYPVRKPS